ncbi:MAG: DNA cytosine methyltransferase [Rhodobacteraceae bacterium]|nr:DNA cytosine methyltransferase [Paracoccaceae bacterium]
MNTFQEFFVGGGMARAGLGKGWCCVFANDFDRKKAATYRRNWGGAEMVVDDIRNIGPDALPGRADLVWASFPCQDLSLAGGGAGLHGERSGTFWPFIARLNDMNAANRAPTIIALENVPGTLTSHKGTDFIAICAALDKLGYRYGAFIADASHFVPQSRPRLFVIAVENGVDPVNAGTEPMTPWHTPALRTAHGQLPERLNASWLWWRMPKPPKRRMRLADVIEANPASMQRHSAVETRTLLSMMSAVNLAKVETARAAGVVMVGGVYKRTRYHHGIKVQRAEVRFDDVAGCLRTPAGGSSRQLILVVDGARIRSRLLSTREAARLMGLPDSYQLPCAYNEAYHLTGDGIAVPVVRYIAKHILEPVIQRADGARA